MLFYEKSTSILFVEQVEFLQIVFVDEVLKSARFKLFQDLR